MTSSIIDVMNASECNKAVYTVQVSKSSLFSSRSSNFESKCILKKKSTVCSCLFLGVEEITLTKFMIGIHRYYHFNKLFMLTD